MNPYERRILHSALSESADVKTQSEGKEPNRYVSIIPNNLEDPNDKGIFEKRSQGGKRDFKVGRNDRGDRGDRRDGFRGGKFKGGRRDGGFKGGRDFAPRQPRPKTSGFGTFLGNSNNVKNDGE